jgi:hypothetical protein
VLAIVKDTALSIIANQVRLDAAVLQAASGGLGAIDDDERRLERARRRLELFETEAAESLEEVVEGSAETVSQADDAGEADAAAEAGAIGDLFSVLK